MIRLAFSLLALLLPILLSAGHQVTETNPAPDIPADAPFIFVNQSGYNAGAPHRFTTVNFDPDAEFIIASATTGEMLHRGNLEGPVGDFTGELESSADELVVRIGGVTSDPFRIGPWWLERVSYEGAMTFAVQSRNYVGNVTEPASHTYAWRDDHHFAFHLRTLVSQYLSHPAAYHRMASTVTYSEPIDGKWGVLAPYDESAPDIVKLIHWAADTKVTQQLTHEFFKGDLVFFLYAWPWMSEWLDEQNFRVVCDFALTHWNESEIDQAYPFDESAPDGHSLFSLKTAIGSEKGPYPPGFSILPNTLMAVVLDRTGDPRADQFREAARQQVAWIVQHIDVENPALTKGQRMSADLLMSSLATFARIDPTGLPPNFDSFIQDWSSVVIRRSANLWDFFQLTDDGHWVAYVDGHETKWNDPGSVLALPSAVLAAAELTPDRQQRTRLVEIAYAAIDHAFGRNPTGRHFSFDAPREIEGVERGWYSYYVGGVGQLDDVPFTFDGAPKAPHYPYHPEAGNISWTEGWVSFNNAFNRSLAALAYFESDLSLQRTATGISVQLRAPLNFDYSQPEPVALTVTTSSGDIERIQLLETHPLAREHTGKLPLSQEDEATPHNGTLEASPGETVKVTYAHGYYQHTAQITVE